MKNAPLVAARFADWRSLIFIKRGGKPSMNTILENERDGGKPAPSRDCGVDRLSWNKSVVLDHERLSPGAVRLALHLSLNCVGSKSGKAWHAQETLAQQLGVTDRTIRSWFEELEAAGYVATERGKVRQTNRYQLSKPEAGFLSDRKNSSASDRKKTSCKPKVLEPKELEPKSTPSFESSTPSSDSVGRAREKARTPQPKTRMTDDWEPDEKTCEAIENIGIDLLDLKPHLVEFRLHWIGVPGQAGMKANWGKTLINRVTTLIAWGKLRTREQKAKVISFADARGSLAERQRRNPRGWYG